MDPSGPASTAHSLSTFVKLLPTAGFHWLHLLPAEEARGFAKDFMLPQHIHQIMTAARGYLRDDDDREGFDQLLSQLASVGQHFTYCLVNLLPIAFWTKAQEACRRSRERQETDADDQTLPRSYLLEHPEVLPSAAYDFVFYAILARQLFVENSGGTLDDRHSGNKQESCLLFEVDCLIDELETTIPLNFEVYDAYYESRNWLASATSSPQDDEDHKYFDKYFQGRDLDDEDVDTEDGGKNLGQEKTPEFVPRSDDDEDARWTARTLRRVQEDSDSLPWTARHCSPAPMPPPSYCSNRRGAFSLGSGDPGTHGDVFGGVGKQVERGRSKSSG
ncbi:hypothetical protein VTK73DRAFT_9615 [Phialemonium thermophilum]|uniref:Uncharacterized protein n=1 Tax=Phialemonium thermophilum TaxID=223376 RepID=A0ABR3XL21_9PEZI